MIVAIVGVTILAISIIGGLLLVNRNASDQQRQTKILLFLLYFWMLAFVQLIVSAIGYSVMTRYHAALTVGARRASHPEPRVGQPLWVAPRDSDPPVRML
jgi:multisubunit Na+/H+ antiporter MnhB subunit